MNSAIMFLPVMAGLVGASFTYLFKLFELADSVRRTLVEAKLWSSSSFPEGIANIELNPEWRPCVRGYYMEIQRIYHLLTVNVMLLIAILLGCVIINVYAATLEAIALREGVSALSFAQVMAVVMAGGILLSIVKRVHGRAAFKSEIEAIVANRAEPKRN